MSVLYMRFKTFPKNVVVYLYDDKKELLEIFLDPTIEQMRDYLIQYLITGKRNVYLCFPNLYEVFHTNDFRLFDKGVFDLYGKFGADVDGDLMTIENLIRIGG